MRALSPPWRVATWLPAWGWWREGHRRPRITLRAPGMQCPPWIFPEFPSQPPQKERRCVIAAAPPGWAQKGGKRSSVNFSGDTSLKLRCLSGYQVASCLLLLTYSFERWPWNNRESLGIAQPVLHAHQSSLGMDSREQRS